MQNQYNVIGIMSGTSLDGLDLAFCSFSLNDDGWQYKIKHAVTIPYSKSWQKKLSGAHLLNGESLIALDTEFGRYIGTACSQFVIKNKIKAHFIASHGHTVFHQPKKGFTYQVGNGNAIHSITGLPVVFDFRTLDVHLGGEGAPLVPAGDKMLLSVYDVCLNLGGIANLSADVKGKRIAFDVCFCNMSLNYLMAKAGKSFDKGGALAATGEVNRAWLNKLTKVYDKLRVKRPSLGREVFEKHIQPLLDQEEIPLADRLCTCIESTAMEIIQAVSAVKGKTVLCTGGGAFNSFLITRLFLLGGEKVNLIVPDDAVIKFKEALVFAFLGVLRVRGEANCLRSVTGAARNTSAGLLVGFKAHV